MPLPVPRGLQRVHRVNDMPRGDQRRHPRAAVGLDPDRHLRVPGVLAQVPADQLVQLSHPGRALGQPLLRQHRTLLVHHLHVVMVGSDRITSKTHLPTSAPFRVRAAARYPAGYAGRLAEGRPRAPVSRRLTAHRHSLLGHPGPAGELGLRCLRLTG